jgi:hypothetical protein
MISGVSAGNVTATSAVISWSTDTNSDSQVDYGISSSYGYTSPLDSTLTQSHSVVLSGLAAGTLYHYRVKSKDASGLLTMSGDLTFTTSSAYSVSAAPASGSGYSQRFTFTFSSVANVDSVNVVINSSLTGASACYVIYEPPLNTVDLVDDSGTAIAGRLTPGSGTLSNSQCSIAGTSVAVIASSVTLSATVTFTPAFAGSKTIWASWYSGGQQQGNWQNIGSWTVPSGSSTGMSVSPPGGAGSSQRFTFNFPGRSNGDSVNMMINSSLTGVGGCLFIYETQSNTLDLVDDSGTAIGGRVTPGSSDTLSNSQCSIPASSVVVTMAGGNITVVATVTFTPAFAGSKTIWASWYANSQNQGDWQSIGSWVVPGGSSTGMSVSPPGGAGSSQRFTFNFPGRSNGDSVNMMINSGLAGAGGCLFIYETQNNTLDLVDDSGTAIGGRVTPGSSDTLSNSQCSIPASSIVVTMAGGNITVMATVTFTPAFAGSKTIWASWYADSQNQGDWQSIGSWIVQ